MDELINRNLGGYQIIEQIGIGGMATVYKAYQANMDRYVAIKVLPRQLAEDPSFLARFEQEARTIARLENKNILPVYDYGTQDGYTYLVMRYVGHGTLKDLTMQGPLPLPTAVDFLEQIAEALQYAHDKGVIHRDVKTSNVLIDEHQQCYLTDFGIAKLAASSAHFTASGALIGTPAYMSPEQCSGTAIDHRSDLYSLGIVLYEMLTGSVPYQAETPVAIVLMHMQEPPPSPRKLNPNIPEPVEQVVFRALAKSPDDRYQSARDFAQALRQAVEKATDSETLSLPKQQAGFSAHVDFSVSGATQTPTQLSAPTTPTPPNVRTYTLNLTRKRVIGAVLALVALLVVWGALSNRQEETTIAETETVAASSAPNTPTTVAASEVAGVSTARPSPLPPTATSPPTASPTLPPSPTQAPTPTVVTVPPPTESAPFTTTDTEEGFRLDVFTTTRGQDDTQRQIALTRGGIWISSGGGLEFWTREGDSVTYNSADGLLFNKVQTLSVDRQGALWVLGGDTPGVMRLLPENDGSIKDIQIFTATNSALQSDFAWALYPERDGVLVGTYDTLIEAWDEKDGWHPPDFPTRGSALEKVGDRVWALVRTRDGTLWAGGPIGLAWLAPDTQEWHPMEAPPELRGWDYETVAYTHFYSDRVDDSLWVFGYTEPVWKPFVARLVYEPEGDAGFWRWDALPVVLPDDVQDIVRTADGTLWVALYDKVVRYMPDGRDEVFATDDGLPGDVFLHIAADRDGTVWVTSDNGLAFFDGERWEAYLSDFRVPLHNTVALGEDSEGTVWFVSPYGDLMNLDSRGDWYIADSLETSVWDMRIVGDVWWFATDQGLLRWEWGIMRRYTEADGLTDNRVLTLAPDPQDDALLWVGTADGLNVLNTETDAVRTWTYEDGALPAPAVTLLSVDWRGRLWGGVGSPPDEDAPFRPTLLLRKRDPNDGTDFAWVPFGEPDAPFGEDERAVLSLAADPQGALWVGTDAMLYRYEAGEWTRYEEEVDRQAPMYTPIQTIYAAGERVLVGTAHEGLFFYDGERWRALGMAGIGSPDVHRIARTSDGSIWILSADSIARLQGNVRAFAGE